MPRQRFKYLAVRSEVRSVISEVLAKTGVDKGATGATRVRKRRYGDDPGDGTRKKKKQEEGRRWRKARELLPRPSNELPLVPSTRRHTQAQLSPNTSKPIPDLHRIPIHKHSPRLTTPVPSPQQPSQCGYGFVPSVEPHEACLPREQPSYELGMSDIHYDSHGQLGKVTDMPSGLLANPNEMLPPQGSPLETCNSLSSAHSMAMVFPPTTPNPTPKILTPTPATRVSNAGTKHRKCIRFQFGASKSDLRWFTAVLDPFSELSFASRQMVLALEATSNPWKPVPTRMFRTAAGMINVAEWVALFACAPEYGVSSPYKLRIPVFDGVFDEADFCLGNPAIKLLAIQFSEFEGRLRDLIGPLCYKINTDPDEPPVDLLFQYMANHRTRQVDDTDAQAKTPADGETDLVNEEGPTEELQHMYSFDINTSAPMSPPSTQYAPSEYRHLAVPNSDNFLRSTNSPTQPDSRPVCYNQWSPTEFQYPPYVLGLLSPQPEALPTGVPACDLQNAEMFPALSYVQLNKHHDLPQSLTPLPLSYDTGTPLNLPQEVEYTSSFLHHPTVSPIGGVVEDNEDAFLGHRFLNHSN